VLGSGDRAVATARRPEQLDDLVRQYGDLVRTAPLDVTDPVAAGAAVQLAHAGHGRLPDRKFAVEGFPEVLRNEVRPFGIKVTIIEPGAFRTDWGGSSMTPVPVSADYDQTVREMNRYRESTVSTWPGDPARAAKIITDIARLREPPLRLLLGAGAVESARQASQAHAAEAEQCLLGRPAGRDRRRTCVHHRHCRGCRRGDSDHPRGRIALPVVGDDASAKAVVIELIDKLGFDGVDVGGLDDSWRQQPGTPVHHRSGRRRCPEGRAPGLARPVTEGIHPGRGTGRAFRACSKGQVRCVAAGVVLEGLSRP